MNTISIQNHQCIPLSDIPVLRYSEFHREVLRLMENTSMPSNQPTVHSVHRLRHRHCVNYFGYREAGQVRLICCIADDTNRKIEVLSTLVKPEESLPSLTADIPAFEKFEREINENFGIGFTGHPWLKPVRYAFNRADLSATIANYPFYSIASEELHEVGVGPVHAGIIEPGHFRFICNGEQILHLEIQLGYQHRGVEQLFLNKTKLLQRTILAENIAGDSVIGHTSAFAYLWESLCGFDTGEDVKFARTMAQELERIAIHTGDLSAICTDIAYQLGSSVYGRLRTPVLNYFQEWCGNRFAKSLVRVGENPFIFTPDLAARLKEVLDAFEPDFDEINEEFFKLPSALSRMERTGALTAEQLETIGVVGMSARINALERDIRSSHPYGLYPALAHEPIIKHHGDVYSRVQVRKQEVKQSIAYLRKMMESIPAGESRDFNEAPEPSSFALSLTEGWRGEICHCAVTDEHGGLIVYKVKDPSFHNWQALALAVRNNEISDFPVCNKSFDLSYCGHDL